MRSIILCLVVPGTLMTGFASAQEDKASEADKFKAAEKAIERSKKMVRAGHEYMSHLYCPDGTRAQLVSVALLKGQSEKTDLYTITCKDGMRGTFLWKEGQTDYPPAPQGFYLR